MCAIFFSGTSEGLSVRRCEEVLNLSFRQPLQTALCITRVYEQPSFPGRCVGMTGEGTVMGERDGGRMGSEGVGELGDRESDDCDDWGYTGCSDCGDVLGVNVFVVINVDVFLW